MAGQERKFTVDPELIKALAEILKETGLGEIEYAEGDRRVRVARPLAPSAVSAPPANPALAAAPAATQSVDSVPAGAVLAPMVGTVYLQAEPGSPPFVRVGDKVKEGQTLVIIEAMKVMNPIRSPRVGTVSRIFVADAQPVEYGEPLVAIE